MHRGTSTAQSPNHCPARNMLAAAVIVAALALALVPGRAGATVDGSASTQQPTAYVFPVQPPAAADYGRDHHTYPATDIFADCGTDVVSPVTGFVHEVNRVDRWDPDVDDPATRGGLHVSIIGDDDVRYYGSHFESIASGIEPGTRVAAGQFLGTVGNTGSARPTPCHLHFGVSPPCGTGDWEVRRGVVWPWPYLDAWLEGEALSPADEVAAWAADNPDVCPQPSPPTVRIDRACPADRVPGAGFVDVGGVHTEAIDCVAWWGVAQGVSADRYAPTVQATRGQMATLIARTLGSAGVDLPAPSDQGFADVPGTTHEDAINQLAALGIVSGHSATRYDPGGNMTRGQMATIIVQAHEHSAATSLPTPEASFLDIEGLTHEASIRKAAEAGFVSGRSRYLYLPHDTIQRAPMASFLARTLDRFVADGLATPP